MTSGLNHTGIGLAEEGASDDEDIDMDYSMNMDPNNECMLDCVYSSLCSGYDLGMLNNHDTLIDIGLMLQMTANNKTFYR